MSTNNKKPTISFLDFLSKIVIVLGFLVSLISFIFNFQKWVQEPAAFRIVSITCFLFFSFCSAWFVIRVKKINKYFRLIILIIIYLINAFFYIWLGSWIITPNIKPVIIDNMDCVSCWGFGQDGRGSTVQINAVPGEKKDRAMKIAYAIKKDGYITVTKPITSGSLKNIKSIGIIYKGSNSNSNNSIELKLIYKPDEKGKSVVFSYIWNQATNAKEWTLIKAPLILFNGWIDTGCQAGEEIDSSKVYKIDIAISNKDIDTTGSGILIIDEIIGITD